MKIEQTNEEFKKHLEEQLFFLKSSCDAYDHGDYAEGKRIAQSLRILLHDTSSSTSLTKHLQIKNQPFLSTCIHFSEDSRMQIAKMGLISVFVGGNGENFFVPLDNASERKWLPFDEWWIGEDILIDQSGVRFSRREIVLNIANTDGGSHVDKKLKLEYANLSRRNSLGSMISKDGEWVALRTPELASVRQIGHEVLKTLVKEYTKKAVSRGNGVVIGEVKFSFTDIKKTP